MRKSLFVVVLTVLAVMLLPVVAHAQAPASFTFDSLDYAACTPGEEIIVSFTYTTPAVGVDYLYWTLTNERTGSFTEVTVGLLSMSLVVERYWMLPVPSDVVEGDTLTLQIDTIRLFPAGPALAPPPGTVVETYSLSWTCGTKPHLTGPGCDVFMNIPSTAVVGAFVSDAPIYWKPGEQTSPLVTIPTGNTAWVIGPDSSGMYEKIIWVCNYLWVPSGTIGPNDDEVWQGKPLPTAPVE